MGLGKRVVGPAAGVAVLPVLAGLCWAGPPLAALWRVLPPCAGHPTPAPPGLLWQPAPALVARRRARVALPQLWRRRGRGLLPLELGLWGRRAGRSARLGPGRRCLGPGRRRGRLFAAQAAAGPAAGPGRGPPRAGAPPPPPPHPRGDGRGDGGSARQPRQRGPRLEAAQDGRRSLCRRSRPRLAAPRPASPRPRLVWSGCGGCGRAGAREARA
jgi:hypothetical protein